MVGGALIFCFNYSATTGIYTYCHTLSLHDALPIYGLARGFEAVLPDAQHQERPKQCRQKLLRRDRAELARLDPALQESADEPHAAAEDRKSTRLNSSH